MDQNNNRQSNERGPFDYQEWNNGQQNGYQQNGWQQWDNGQQNGWQQWDGGQQNGWQEWNGSQQEDYQHWNSGGQQPGKPPEEVGPALWVIIVAFVVFWPVGIGLLALRLYREYQSHGKPSIKTRGDWVLLIAGLLCFLVAIGGAGAAAETLFSSYIDWGEGIMYLILTGAFAAGGAVCLVKRENNRRKRIHYQAIIDENAPTVSLDYIKEAYPTSYENVCRDLEQLLAQGVFPGAYLDLRGRQIVFPQNGGEPASEPVPDPEEEARKEEERRRAEAAAKEAEERRKREEEERRRKEEEERRKNMTIADTHLETIRECRDKVDDPVLKGKFDRLEKVTKQIYDRLEEKPSDRSETQRFLTLYLPRIIKVIDVYTDLMGRDIPGKEVADLKKQVDSAMDDFILSFENVLTRLYQEDLVDVSTDITALEAVLAGDGLLDKEVKRRMVSEAEAKKEGGADAGEKKQAPKKKGPGKEKAGEDKAGEGPGETADTVKND